MVTKAELITKAQEGCNSNAGCNAAVEALINSISTLDPEMAASTECGDTGSVDACYTAMQTSINPVIQPTIAAFTSVAARPAPVGGLSSVIAGDPLAAPVAPADVPHVDDPTTREKGNHFIWGVAYQTSLAPRSFENGNSDAGSLGDNWHILSPGGLTLQLGLMRALEDDDSFDIMFRADGLVGMAWMESGNTTQFDTMGMVNLGAQASYLWDTGDNDALGITGALQYVIPINAPSFGGIDDLGGDESGGGGYTAAAQLSLEATIGGRLILANTDDLRFFVELVGGVFVYHHYRDGNGMSSSTVQSLAPVLKLNAGVGGVE